MADSFPGGVVINTQSGQVLSNEQGLPFLLRGDNDIMGLSGVAEGSRGTGGSLSNSTCHTLKLNVSINEFTPVTPH